MRNAELRSIGILGGTFNPPHVGHLRVARLAREQLGLELVVLMPAGTPPHKPAGADPGAGHRLRMCQLTVGETMGVRVCELELDRDGPSYTVDTLQAIHASHPDAELTLIVGADTATTLGSWRHPDRLLELARLAVAARAGSDRQAVLDTVASILGDGSAPGGGPSSGSSAGHARGPGGDAPDGHGVNERAAVRFLDMGTIDVSSSLVRSRAAEHLPLEAQVGADVARYIVEHDLYAGAVVS